MQTWEVTAKGPKWTGGMIGLYLWGDKSCEMWAIKDSAVLFLHW